jgi:choline kinase
MIDEVVILAAGTGSRMAEITVDRPKCMAPFLQGTILSRLLGQLRAYQPKRIHVVGGYKREVLAEYLKREEFAGLPFNLLPNDRYASTNSLISAVTAFEHSRGQLLMFNSDVVYDSVLIRRMVESTEPCAFSLDRSDYNEESEKLCMTDDGRVVQIAKTIAQADATGCSADLYRINLEVSDGLVRKLLPHFLSRPKAARQLFEDYLDHCLLPLRFGAVDISGLEWYEIDTVAELKDAEKVFASIT